MYVAIEACRQYANLDTLTLAIAKELVLACGLPKQQTVDAVDCRDEPEAMLTEAHSPKIIEKSAKISQKT